MSAAHPGLPLGQCAFPKAMIMTHPGLPHAWALGVLGVMAAATVWGMVRDKPGRSYPRRFRSLPGRGLFARRWVLASARTFTAAVFLLVIAAGLFGSPIPQRNIATMLTWTVWWAGVVISVLFVGTAWCAICPWDTIASWLVRRRWWGPGPEGTSLNLRVPSRWLTIWPASFMFVGLTWIELGVGITTSPYATALIALLMVVLATVSMAVFERKAFCRYACPVGRTLGAYSQITTLALGAVDAETCSKCTTLECYYGDGTNEPCPTNIVIGRSQQKHYCTFCGACVASCPHGNVSLQTRPVADELRVTATPRWDEAWFILILVALTSFHGITMIPVYENGIRHLGQMLGARGGVLPTFTIALIAIILITGAIYAIFVLLTMRTGTISQPLHRAFATLAYPLLPVAFSYHIAHNLNHLIREGTGFLDVVIHPFGIGYMPLSMAEMHWRMQHPLLPPVVLFAIQAALMAAGFVIAVRVLRARTRDLCVESGPRFRARAVMLTLLVAVAGLNVWLLVQPMSMRM